MSGIDWPSSLSWQSFCDLLSRNVPRTKPFMLIQKFSRFTWKWKPSIDWCKSSASVFVYTCKISSRFSLLACWPNEEIDSKSRSDMSYFFMGKNAPDLHFKLQYFALSRIENGLRLNCSVQPLIMRCQILNTEQQRICKLDWSKASDLDKNIRLRRAPDL